MYVTGVGAPTSLPGSSSFPPKLLVSQAHTGRFHLLPTRGQVRRWEQGHSILGCCQWDGQLRGACLGRSRDMRWIVHQQALAADSPVPATSQGLAAEVTTVVRNSTLGHSCLDAWWLSSNVC